MSLSINLSNREYYHLWSGRSSYPNPWERQYVNWDFVNFEKKRMENALRWESVFQKRSKGDFLEDVELYYIPCKTNKLFEYKKTLSDDFEGRELIALSALYNSIQTPIYALIDEKKVPIAQSLIRIIKPQKSRIMGTKSPIPFDFIIIDEVIPLPSEKILTDVSVEPNVVSKLIKENLVSREVYATALSSPLMSSPMSFGEVGGISLTSFTYRSKFNEKIINSLLKTLPPFYSNLRPTQSTVKGSWVEMLPGLRINPAENLPNPNSHTQGVSNYTEFSSAFSKRLQTNGEYSILSNFGSSFDSASKGWFHDITSFSNSEVFIPSELDEFIDMSGLKKFESEINEDIWIQIAHSRQLNPIVPEFEKEKTNYKNKIMKDLETLTADLGRGGESIIGELADQSVSNLFRNSAAIARLEGKGIINNNNLVESRNLFLDTFNDFWQSPQIDLSKKRFKESKDKLSTKIRLFLHNSSLSEIEIWEKLGKESTDFHKLTRSLSNLSKADVITKDYQGLYSLF